MKQALRDELETPASSLYCCSSKPHSINVFGFGSHCALDRKDFKRIIERAFCSPFHTLRVSDKLFRYDAALFAPPTAAWYTFRPITNVNLY